MIEPYTPSDLTNAKATQAIKKGPNKAGLLHMASLKKTTKSPSNTV